MMEHNDHDLLIRLDEKLDDLLQRFTVHDETHKTVDLRVTALERWQWQWAGAISVGILLVSFFAQLMTRMFIR